MKKLKKLLIFMLVMTMLLATGCASNDDANTAENDTSQDTEINNPVDELGLDYSTGLDENGFFSDVKAGDIVQLGEYNNISVPKENHTITEEIIQANIDDVLSNFTTDTEVTDRALVNGDTVNIDYVGSVDGVEFQGGSTGGNGTIVTIGVTAYIDDFLEQLIGHNPGESFDIEVTFPENYGNEELNGKDAIFAITINYINETTMPELTDAFVSENLSSAYGTQTVEELKALIQTDLKDSGIKTYIQNYLIENSIVTIVPETIVTYQQTMMTNYYEMSAISNGMTLEQLLQTYEGYENVEALLEASAEQIYFNSQFALIIQAIAEEANIAITEDELKDYFLKYTDSDDYSQFEEIYGLPYLKNSILQDNVLTYLSEQAVLEN